MNNLLQVQVDGVVEEVKRTVDCIKIEGTVYVSDHIVLVLVWLNRTLSSIVITNTEKKDNYKDMYLDTEEIVYYTLTLLEHHHLTKEVDN